MPRRPQPSPPSARPGQRLAAGLCVALILTLGLLAASPTLHHWLHHDAGQPGHECAITLFAHGAPPVAALPALTPPAAHPWPASLPARENLSLAAPARRLPPAQAPPAA